MVWFSLSEVGACFLVVVVNCDSIFTSMAACSFVKNTLTMALLVVLVTVLLNNYSQSCGLGRNVCSVGSVHSIL